MMLLILFSLLFVAVFLYFLFTNDKKEVSEKSPPPPPPPPQGPIISQMKEDAYKKVPVRVLSVDLTNKGSEESPIMYNSNKLFSGIAYDVYDTGQLKHEKNYNNGKQHGFSYFWYDTGQLMVKNNYKNGKLDGLQEGWDENGQLSDTGNYKNGKEDGVFRDWTLDGKLFMERIYKNGEEISLKYPQLDKEIDGLLPKFKDQLVSREKTEGNKRDRLDKSSDYNGQFKTEICLKNGLKHELSDENLNQKYHQLSSYILKVCKHWLETTNTNRLAQSKIFTTSLEVKLFGFAFFLNQLKKDEVGIFNEFVHICFSHFKREIDQLELRAHEDMYFYIPFGLDRGNQYLADKIANYIDDIENFRKNRSYPKFTHVSITNKPLDSMTTIHSAVQTCKTSPQFRDLYKDSLEKLEFRYNNTPGVKNQEEIDKEKKRLASIPKGSTTMNPVGIDVFEFGQTTQDIIKLIGHPEKRSKYEESKDINEYFSYFSLGISLGFYDNCLVYIQIFSGRPQGHGANKYLKYTFRKQVPFSMDSFYNDVLKLYGPPLRERDFPKAKIHIKRLDYGRFQFTFYVETGQLNEFVYKTDKLVRN